MKKILILGFFLPMVVQAQNERPGIKFESGVSWLEVLAKAKKENKLIFMDCFATWCSPCKTMDAQIYPNDTVGMAVNRDFISIKVQFDSTENDNADVKEWYAISKELNQKYKIEGYPSFLFFSSEGKLLHRSLGAKNTKEFVKLVDAAKDPLQQDYALVEGYREGKRDYAVMDKQALAAKRMHDKDFADSIANDYIINYLSKLDDNAYFNKENLSFVLKSFPAAYYRDGLKGRIFKLFFADPEKGDKIMGKGYSDRAVKAMINYKIRTHLYQVKDDKFIIKNENVVAVTKKPDWSKIESELAIEFNGDARVSGVLKEYKPSFYLTVTDWETWADLFDEKLRANPPTKYNVKAWSDMFGLGALNGNAWTVFRFCENRKVLKRALAWSELSIRLHKESDVPVSFREDLDTRANLLYKLGRVKEAIAQEEEVVRLDLAEAKKQGREKGNDELEQTLKKMKEGTPTWVIKK